MQTQRKKVAVLVCDLFEQAEFEEPVRFLREAGAEVAIVSASGKESLQGMRHAKLGDSFQADILLDDANAEMYDALVLPGGALNADQLRMVPKARAWALYFLDTQKLVAAICHAPWLLVSADAVEERRLTSYFTIQDDIRNAGGAWVDLSVVTDGNLITSRQPDDLPEFNQAVIAWLRQDAHQLAMK